MINSQLYIYGAGGSWKDTLYYTHDLQKNVTALFGGQVNRRAKYQYDAYGNLTLMEGDAAEENPYRYSSEYHDADLGLIYYNYRHYNPIDGRWITRDPIAERGGANLYGFVRNAPVFISDIWGLQDQPLGKGIPDKAGHICENTINVLGGDEREAYMTQQHYDWIKDKWFKEVAPHAFDGIQEKDLKIYQDSFVSMVSHAISWGCIGVTSAMFGIYQLKAEKGDFSNCYKSIDQAKNALKSVTCPGKNENGEDACPHIFSIHFHSSAFSGYRKERDSKQRSFAVATGKVEVPPIHFMKNRGNARFDFAFLYFNNKNYPANTLQRANHSAEVGTCQNRGEYMHIFTSSLEEWQKEVSRDAHATYDMEVWCVACERQELSERTQEFSKISR